MPKRSKNTLGFARNWWRNLPRLLLVSLSLLCLGLGYWGFTILARTAVFVADWDTHPADLWFYTIQLFIGASGPVSGAAAMGLLPWQLEVARLLAPAAGVIGAIVAILVIFDEQIQRAAKRARHGHVILLGDSPTARVVEAALEVEDAEVLLAASGSKADLVAAGVRGATAVYLCDDDAVDPGANLRVASQIRNIPARRMIGANVDRVVAVSLSDPELTPALLARHLIHPDSKLDLFNMANLTAARLAEYVMKRPGISSVWLLGSGPVRDEMVSELAQEWSIRRQPGSTLTISVIGPDSDQAIEAATARLSEGVLRGLTYRAAESVGSEGIIAADAVVVCGRDDAEALHLALSTPSAWAGGAKSLTVNVTHGAQADALFGASGIGLLDDLNGVLDVIPTSKLIVQSHYGVLVHEPVIDRMAQAALRTNLRQIELEGFIAPHGEHLVPWDQMDNPARQRHRQRIATIPPILAALEANDWKVVPFASSLGVSLTPEVIAAMARDIYSNTDPNKQPFDTLPPDVKQLKIARVSHLPETLAQLGLGITNISKNSQLAAIGQPTAVQN